MVFPTEQTLQYIERLYSKKMNKSSYTSITSPSKGGDVIDDDVARFFQLLLLMKQPKHILEIGTSIGYSTVSMAQIVQSYGGKITTIELDPQTVEKAKLNFQRYQVDSCIEQLIGDAKKILPTLTPKFGYIFMDVGDKSLYYQLFDNCVALLQKGGIFVAEDSLYGSYFKESIRDGEYREVVNTLNDFNQLVAKNSDVESTLLPIGDGVTVAVKK